MGNIRVKKSRSCLDSEVIGSLRDTGVVMLVFFHNIEHVGL